MRAQLNESMGLRSTRTTARQREVPEAGTSNVSEPEALRKTHLTCGRPGSTPAALPSVYSGQAADSTTSLLGAHYHHCYGLLELRPPSCLLYSLRLPSAASLFRACL